MNNFQINTNFNTAGFENSISDFNTVFNNSLDKTNENLSSQSFDEIFNSMSPKPLNAGVEFFENNNQTQNLSPTAKLAKDIQGGFSNGINELNAIEKKSEQDIETFASGGDISIHEVMISAQKSSLAMQMAIQLRNQMITAYNEFKNMSI